jgi:hypothetical protein
MSAWKGVNSRLRGPVEGTQLRKATQFAMPRWVGSMLELLLCRDQAPVNLQGPAGRERVLTSVQVGVGSVGLGDGANRRKAIVVSMSLVMPGERRSELDRVRPSSPVLARTPVAPRNYVNVEKLLEDVVRLHALRDVILLGLDDLDAASVKACKPIRSVPARGSMSHLLTMIRDAEVMARKIWQEEVAASGVVTPRLATLLTKAAAADAQTVQRLVKRDGKSLNDAEYDELLDVLNGAVVDPDRGGLGVTEYAKAFVNGLDPKLLQRLLVELREALSPVYQGTGKQLRAEKVLHELRMLFANVLSGSAAEVPGLVAIVDGLSVESLNVLLLPEPAPWKLARINDVWLGRLALRILPDGASLHSSVANFDGDQLLPSPRMTVLRLLAENQTYGGRALADYMKPFSRSERHMDNASNRMLALLSPNSFFDKGSTGLRHASLDEEALAAEVVKQHFLAEFGSTDRARVAAAGEALELAISGIEDLKAVSKPMTQSLAWAFSGLMTNPLINQQLLESVSKVRGVESAWTAGNNDGFDPGNDQLFAFLGLLAKDSGATRIVAGSIGPMITSTAKLFNRLPTRETLAEGAGYILGAMQAQVDRDNASRRNLVEGLAMSATVLAASAGGLVGGPTGATATGFLGSGIVDFLAAKLNTDRYPAGVAFGTKEVEDYFKKVYVLAAFQWLDEPTKVKIVGALKANSMAPASERLKATYKASSVPSGPNGQTQIELKIANLDVLKSADLDKLLSLMSDAATSDNEGQTQSSIKNFALLGAQNAAKTRERRA